MEEKDTNPDGSPESQPDPANEPITPENETFQDTDKYEYYFIGGKWQRILKFEPSKRFLGLNDKP